MKAVEQYLKERIAQLKQHESRMKKRSEDMSKSAMHREAHHQLASETITAIAELERVQTIVIRSRNDNR